MYPKQMLLKIILQLLTLSQALDGCVASESCESLGDEFFIPKIDFSRYDESFESLSDNVIHGLTTSGFLSVFNIEGLDTTGLYEVSEWFFNLPPWHKAKLMKHKWNPANSNTYRGYYPIIPDDPSYKEAIEFRRNISYICNDCTYPESSLCEDSVYFDEYDKSMSNDFEKMIEFREMIDKQYETLLNVAKLLMRLIAYGLQKDENVDTQSETLNINDVYYFEPMFLPFTLSTLRLMHSPPHHTFESREKEIIEVKHAYASHESEFALSTPEHTDGGFLTLVITYQKGLQVEDHATGKWYSANETATAALKIKKEDNGYKNGLVVNIGETLSHMTNGYLRATRHRVQNMNEDRYSIAFFFEPQYHTKVINITDGHRIVEYGEFVVDFDKQFAEYSDEHVGMCFYYQDVYDCDTTTDEWIQRGI